MEQQLIKIARALEGTTPESIALLTDTELAELTQKIKLGIELAEKVKKERKRLNDNALRDARRARRSMEKKNNN